jgi:hypothetical protein
MDISALWKSGERTRRRMQPLIHFINENANVVRNRGRQHAVRFEALPAIQACHEMEVTR